MFADPLLGYAGNTLQSNSYAVYIKTPKAYAEASFDICFGCFDVFAERKGFEPSIRY